MDSAELSHIKNRTWMLEKAWYFFSVLRDDASRCSAAASGRFAMGLEHQGHVGKLVGSDCDRQRKQGHCDLCSRLLRWCPRWMGGCVPDPSPRSPSTHQRSPLSPRGGWERFVRPQGRGNGVILPLGGLCPLWLKICFPEHLKWNWRGFVNSLCQWGICLISCLSLEALYT